LIRPAVTGPLGELYTALLPLEQEYANGMIRPITAMEVIPMNSRLETGSIPFFSLSSLNLLKLLRKSLFMAFTPS
jgi:hypothetical protein